MRVELDGGETIELGTLETSPTLSLIDYSRRTTDDFGVTTVVKRGFARRLSCRLSVAFDAVDDLELQLADLRATTALWVADERFASLSISGFYKDFSLDLSTPPTSFCSLTIEGLTEAEPAADFGDDPAPVGQTSTLRLLQPILVTPINLTSTSVAEDDYPEWSDTTTYGVGARVIKAATHKVYESAVTLNTGNDPEAGTGQWVEVGPTNPWAMFDQALGTTTSDTDVITVTVDPGTVDAVALLDVTGATVRVQRAGYDRTLYVGAGPVTFLDLPRSDTPLTVTIAGTGAVSVGTLLIGTLAALGITEASPTSAISDFSIKSTDDFGAVTLVERAWAKRMEARALVRTDAIDSVIGQIATVRAVPSLWIGEDQLDSLTLYGFFKEASIAIGETVSVLSLSIEGLSKAAPLAESGVALLNPRGDYSAATTYSVGDVVVDAQGDSYVRTGTGDTTGIDPSDTSKWTILVEAGKDGADGLNGTDGVDGQDGKLVEFVWQRAATIPDAPTGNGIPAGWSDDPPADDGNPLWMSKAKQELDGTLVTGETWSTPIRHDGPKGDDGLPGYTSAKVYIYQRAATAPALPTAAVTYTFADGSITGLDNGWSKDIPGGSNPLYVAVATATATTATDTIAANEWSAPVILAQNGTGGAGSDGLNSASIYLFKRAATTPSLPSATTTYSFPTSVLTGLDNGWGQAVPAYDGNPLWVTSATAAATTNTDSIASSEWAAPQIMAKDGAAGVPGYNNAQVLIYQRAASAPALPSASTTYTFATKALTGLDNGWSTSPPAGTNPLYVAAAVASSQGATDTIAANEWSTPVVLAQNGTNGTNGATGLNSAPVFLYQRAVSQPAVPSTSTTYTFASGAISGQNNGWLAAIPANDGNPVWVTTAAAASTSATDTIAAGEWATPQILAENGADGQDGQDGVSPVGITLSPSSIVIKLNSDGSAASGELPFTFTVLANQNGSSIPVTSVTLTSQSGGTFTVSGATVSLTAISGTSGQCVMTVVAGGQTIAGNQFTFTTSSAGTSVNQLNQNVSLTLGQMNQTTYAQVGPTLSLPAKTDGTLKVNLTGSLKPNIDGYAFTAKLQYYNATAGGSWVDVPGSTHTSNTSADIFGGEPGTTPKYDPCYVNGTGPYALTGFTSGDSIQVRIYFEKASGAGNAAGNAGNLTLFLEGGSQ